MSDGMIFSAQLVYMYDTVGFLNSAPPLSTSSSVQTIEESVGEQYLQSRHVLCSPMAVVCVCVYGCFVCVACHVGANLLAESSSTQIAPPPERLPTKVSCLNELLIAAPHQFIPPTSKEKVSCEF